MMEHEAHDNPQPVRRLGPAGAPKRPGIPAAATPAAALQVSENGATAAAGPMTASGPLAALFSQHVLRDGEIILLILKPSLWFILFNCLRWFAAIAILVLAVILMDDRIPGYWRARTYEAAVFVLAGRIMWAVLQWMGRLYVLTDLRILRLSGVFWPDIFDCPLRKVARARLIQSLRDRLLGLGSIEIIPFDDAYPVGLWQTIGKPRQVHDQVVAAINKAKHIGAPGDSQ